MQLDDIRQLKRDFDYAPIVDGVMYGFFVSFLFLSSLILISRIETLRIGDIVIDGAYYVSNDDLDSKATDFLNTSKCMRIADCGNFTFIPRIRLTHYLLREFPRLKTIVYHADGEKLVVSVTEKEHSAHVCVINSQDCWFIDEDGIAFARSPYFSPGVYPLFVIGKPLDTLPVQALSRWTYRSTMNFVNQADLDFISFTQHERYSTLVIGSLSDKKVATGVDVLVKNSDLRNPQTYERLIDILKRIQSSDAIEREFMAGKRPLYIDLRFDGKVFYKFE
jgi:hypothetical protein